MSGRLAFEYAVLRAVPRVERGECLNVGVVLYCQGADYLRVLVHVDEDRLRALDPGVDADLVRAALADLDARLAAEVVPLLEEVLELVPGQWLTSMNAAQGDPRTPAQWRSRYVEQLAARAGGERPWFSLQAAA